MNGSMVLANDRIIALERRMAQEIDLRIEMEKRMENKMTQKYERIIAMVIGIDHKNENNTNSIDSRAAVKERLMEKKVSIEKQFTEKIVAMEKRMAHQNEKNIVMEKRMGQEIMSVQTQLAQENKKNVALINKVEEKGYQARFAMSKRMSEWDNKVIAVEKQLILETESIIALEKTMTEKMIAMNAQIAQEKERIEKAMSQKDEKIIAKKQTAPANKKNNVGESVLQENSRTPILNNRVPSDVQQYVIHFAISNPEKGEKRASNELKDRGIHISSNDIRSIWSRNGLENKPKRLKASELNQDKLV
eukprot:GHVL01009531.1.p1 GENE.GHVL01009531.1~~GHVL01009531.1.p1  ORF type:complete len:305 (+),score=74.91 GHVL01009531.1:61-975(+)